jgi:hypothetical protein
VSKPPSEPGSLFGTGTAAISLDGATSVETARAELRKLLPELRTLPGFPHGSDDDIVAMSYPPYYTACPNPFITGWLSALDRPDDDGRSDPGPFAADVTEGKGNAFYKAHSFPTKVPHPAIMRFILHYTKPGDVVLDGFGGSGMTGVAAQACGKPDAATKAAIERELGADNVEWGTRRAILGDLGPAATFIAAGMNLPFDANKFNEASQRLLKRFEEEYGWMYKTTVIPENGAPFEADIDYTIWSEVFTCPHCGSELVFYDAAFMPESGTVRDSFSCRSCGAQVRKDRLERRMIKTRTLAGDAIERVELRPVRIVWRTREHLGEKSVDEADEALLARVSRLALPSFPSQALPLDAMVHGTRLGPKGFQRVHHLWCDRALASVALLWSWAADEADPGTTGALHFWIEQALWGLSWMNRYKANDHSQVNRQMTGVYYVPSLVSECSVRYNLEGGGSLRGKRQSLVKLWSAAPWHLGDVVITTGSSTNLPVASASVDYIFVDPPFGKNIPYSDLALVVEAWHRVTTAVDEEATEDGFKGRALDDYAEIMARCFAEFFRVLKPGRWITVEFSNHSNDVWLRIQNALSFAGFVVADTRVIDKEQLSYRQVTAEHAVKHDLVISAYKPAQATEHTFEVAAGSADGAWAFVREHLSRIPATEGVRGQALVVRERQADRIYERMVGYHVARNTLVPLTAAEFYTGLEQRFPVRDGMYFLPDQVEQYERFRMTFKELAAQELFIRDESTAVQWLRQMLRSRPRTFADIQPGFMRELQNGIASWEELPDLRGMLESNFVTDEKGRFAVPDPKKTEHLDQLRTRALLKEFESYTTGKRSLTKFRSEAVRAGFREAWGRRDFATIAAVGRRLPSEVFVEDSALLHYFRNAERLAE